MAISKTWLTIGSVRKKKDKEGTYIKISKDIMLREGQALQVSDPRSRYDRLVANGKMTEEEAEEKKSSVPDYILFDIVLPPND